MRSPTHVASCGSTSPERSPVKTRPGSLASAVAGVQVLLAELEDLDTVLLGAGLVDLVADSLTTAA